MSQAAARVNRSEKDIALVAVTKHRSLTEIAELKTLGQTLIGESRVQELKEKYEALSIGFDIHFIGHLQTNKVRPAVEMSAMIHSVDSLKLLTAINETCGVLNKKMPVLLQVNASLEPQKHGFMPPDLLPALESARGLKNISVQGLMTMAMLTDDTVKIRSVFSSLRLLRNDLTAKGHALPHLSMGMSDDFEIAIEEGATLIRVGGALFERS